MKQKEEQADLDTQGKNNLKIITIGGVEEIGRNHTVIEYKNDIIIIDAGIMFPDYDDFGVDLIMPDFQYVIENKKKVRGIVITHGHEDHIGALHYLLQEINVPVYATRFSKALINKKLDEKCKKNNFSINEVKPRQFIDLGCFTIEMIRVNHSIPDSVGLAIQTPVGIIVHSGDFKVDFTPADSLPIDLNRFAYYGDKGVLLLLTDSTNAEHAGFTPSEATLIPDFSYLFKNAPGRIIFATFASNLSRIQQIIDLAKGFDKKIALSGRSMIDNIDIAQRLGYLKNFKNLFINIDKAKNLDPQKTIIITTGTQGEPFSSLMMMSKNKHKNVTLNANDTLILSSSTIPGNETAIRRVINNISRKGVSIFNEASSAIHVSGHAAQEELKLLYSLIKPKFIIPVHGDPKHKTAYAQLVASLNFPKENVFFMDNGSILHINSKKAFIDPKAIPVQNIFLDGKGIGDIDEIILKERSGLADHGIIIISILIEKYNFKNLNITSYGFIDTVNSKTLLNDVEYLIQNIIKENLKRKTEKEEFKNEIRKKIKRLFSKQISKYPIIHVELIYN